MVTSLAGFAGSKPLKVVHVRRSIWRGQEQEPKTPNAVRVVDIPEVLAMELRPYVSSISGYLFATKQGACCSKEMYSVSSTRVSLWGSTRSDEGQSLWWTDLRAIVLRTWRNLDIESGFTNEIVGRFAGLPRVLS